jgi:N6-L-threonylcarbamoyladenine synthase
MKILAIETSCDDTCVAVLEDNRILSNVISSQVDLHAKWGGVVPDIAKRAHQERIEAVLIEALIRSNLSVNKLTSPLKKGRSLNDIKELIKDIDVIGVTQGPGLAIALSVGVNKAKELAVKYSKKLVAVNHIEGHIWANFLKNRNGKPERKLEFPVLVLTVSGGHTKIILIEDVGKYKIIGETLDDAAGEALDKAAKMLGLGYPGGPIIERLAKDGDVNFLDLPHPLADKKILDYSFSGLKTSFYYKVKDWPKEKVYKNLNNLAATFQNAVFETLLRKYKLAIEKYQPKLLLASGGVLANLELRKRLRKLAKEMDLPIYMPAQKNLNTDNAAMVGIVAYEKAMRGEFVEDIDKLDRNPRLEL